MITCTSQSQRKITTSCINNGCVIIQILVLTLASFVVLSTFGYNLNLIAHHHTPESMKSLNFITTWLILCYWYLVVNMSPDLPKRVNYDYIIHWKEYCRDRFCIYKHSLLGWIHTAIVYFTNGFYLLTMCAFYVADPTLLWISLVFWLTHPFFAFVIHYTHFASIYDMREYYEPKNIIELPPSKEAQSIPLLASYPTSFACKYVKHSPYERMQS